LKQVTYLLVLTFLPFLFPAQQPILKNFSTKNGLPSNEVYFLHQDKKGFIWICSDAGLVKYNGNYFKKFNSSNGLPDNTIFEVKEDKKGRIWYRSFSGKIGYIFNDTVFTIQANKKIEDFVKDGIISSFALDENGILYLGKKNSDYISFLKISPPYSPDNVLEIWKNKSYENGMDIICIGTEDFIFSDKRGTVPGYFNSYILNIYNNHHDLLLADSVKIPENSLFTRIFRRKKDIYFLANKLLKKIDISDRTITEKIFQNNIITVISLDTNIVLVGERNQGMALYLNDLNKEPFDHLLDGSTFTYAIRDYQNGHWFSTLESGVFYIPSQKINYNITGNIAADRITQLFNYNDSTLLMGFYSGRFMAATYEKSKKISCTEIYSDEKNQLGIVSSVFKLSNGSLIVSGSLGSINLDIGSKRVKKILIKKNASYNLQKMLSYKDSLLGITLRNIYVFNHTFDKIGSIYKSKDRLTTVSCDSVNGKIYLGGLRGLYNFYFQKDINEKDKVLNCRVEDIKSISGKIYIATNGEGLIIKSGNDFDTINEKKGLISNICKSITTDRNTIWVSTNSGISKVVYNSKDSFNVNNYELSSFTGATSINRICLLKDKAFFYSGNRLYSFSTKINPTNVRFYISLINVNNHPYKIKSFLDLDYTQSNVLIGYEALFYDCNTVINYRYKISKESHVWNYTNETKVNFPSLSPGNYEFIVEAQDNQGHWIPADANVAFKIEKPFWQMAWFILLLVLMFMGLIVLMLRYRYKTILKQELHKNALKMRMYELESKAVKAQMNPHFIFNSLSSIQEFILSNDSENAYKYLSRFSKLVRRLLESSTSESITLETEIDILKRYLEIEALRFQDAFSYEFHIDKELNALQIQIPHMLIQPFVENAIWHGLLHKNHNKKLEIRFNILNENCLICTVEDNGVGRHFKKKDVIESTGKKSMSTEFINQRLNLMGKIKNVNYGFEIIDKRDSNGLGIGTTVRIEIPILNA
jgi:hypothetical protein